MKYIIYIIIIAITTSVSLLYKPAAQQSKGQQAIRVNGRSVSQQELDEKTIQQSTLLGGPLNITNSLIMREILIDEALQQHIDQNESFQKQIKNFYEQSLVSVLVERKLNSISYSPTAEEIEAYKNLLGRQISLELRAVSPEREVDVPGEAPLEKLSGLFEDLSLPLRMNILFVSEQQTSKPAPIFGGLFTIYAKKIGAKKETGELYEEEEIKASIIEYRKEEIFHSWLQSLRGKATIELTQNKQERELP